MKPRARTTRPSAIGILLLGIILVYAAWTHLPELDHAYLPGWDEAVHATVAGNLLKHPLTPTLFDQPFVPYDLHNWQAKDVDGAVAIDPERWDRLQEFLPSGRAFGKRWWWRGPPDPPILPDGRQTVREYCREHYGAPGVAFECGWFGRQPADVRALGTDLLHAVLLVEAQWSSTYR